MPYKHVRRHKCRGWQIHPSYTSVVKAALGRAVPAPSFNTEEEAAAALGKCGPFLCCPRPVPREAHTRVGAMACALRQGAPRCRRRPLTVSAEVPEPGQFAARGEDVAEPHTHRFRRLAGCRPPCTSQPGRSQRPCSTVVECRLWSSSRQHCNVHIGRCATERSQPRLQAFLQGLPGRSSQAPGRDL